MAVLVGIAWVKLLCDAPAQVLSRPQALSNTVAQPVKRPGPDLQNASNAVVGSDVLKGVSS